jgi:hypothetical protein
MVELAPARASPLFLCDLSCLRIPKRADLAARFHLLFLRAPLHIARFVITIIVDAIETVFRTRAATDRSEKIGEKDLVAFIPRRMNGDAAPAVVSAITDAIPHLPVLRISQRDQPTESLICDVDKTRHYSPLEVGQWSRV